MTKEERDSLRRLMELILKHYPDGHRARYEQVEYGALWKRWQGVDIQTMLLDALYTAEAEQDRYREALTTIGRLTDSLECPAPDHPCVSCIAEEALGKELSNPKTNFPDGMSAKHKESNE